MVFNSLTFLLFLGVVVGVHRLPLRWKLKKTFLLLASYVFYAAWNPPFVILLWISTLVDWTVAKRVATAASPTSAKRWLLVSLCTNLGLLGVFKYGGFMLDNFVALTTLLGVPFQPAAWDIILPVGISFYTFQTLSYTIDVYRKKLEPWPEFVDFALYVTFFPQLVAGPIVRAVDFLPQCSQPRQANAKQMGWGLTLLAFGLFQKMTLADTIMAPVVDQVYSSPDKAGFMDAWIGTLAFSAQIFFDFAGYSTCAIGVALCLGFMLPDNFRYPYAAVGFSDFWRRWHISLSSWLRDYLYIPLGGNRKGRRRTTINLALTMLLGGLWHGAAWQFVVWGALHGIYLGVERMLRARWGGRPFLQRGYVQLALCGVTYFWVCIAWVFFRAPNFTSAATLLGRMTVGGPDDLILGLTQVGLVGLVLLGLLVGQWLMRNRSLGDIWAELSPPLRTGILTFVLVALALTPGDDRAFIYFQF